MSATSLQSPFLTALIASVLLTFCSGAQDLKPEEIHEKVSPMLVELEGVDGMGSGIVIGQGLALTSLHVVAAGMDLSVSGYVEVPGGKRVLHQFKGGRLHKVHPSLDLALVKFDAEDQKLIPASIPKKPAKVANGSACYALGSPSGGAGGLSSSITDGVISSAQRLIGGDPLIQFSAPVNPGNSGGALCDASGTILGVVTFKLEQREGIAFAIPFGGIDLDSFISPSERKGDVAMIKKYLDQARQYDHAAVMTLFNGRGSEQEYLAAAVVIASLALIEQPSNMEAFQLLSSMYLRLGEVDLGRAFAQRGLELKPGDPSLIQSLGLIELRAKNQEAAEAAFRMAMEEPEKNRALSSSSLTKLAEVLSKKPEPDWNQIAYLCGWARELLTGTDQKSSPLLQQTRKAALEQADEDVAAILLRPKKDFSKKELEQLGKSEIKLPEQVTLIRKLFSEEKRIEWAQQSLELGEAGAAPDNGEEGVIPLPDHFTQALPVMGGSQVVLTFEKLNKIAIFDMASGMITRFITPPKTDMVVAAGGKRLVLVDREEITWHVYDLSNPDEGSKIWSRKGGQWKLSDAAMSPYRSDLAWFVFSQEGGAVGVVLCALDADEPFQRLPIPVEDSGLMRFLQDGGEIDTSATGMTLLGRRGNSSSTQVLRLDTRLARLTHTSRSDLRGYRPSVHPSMLVTNHSIIGLPDWNTVWRTSSGNPGLFPIFGSESFLHATSMRSKRTNGARDLHIRVLSLPEPDMKSEPFIMPLELAGSTSELARKLPFILHATLGSRKIAVFDNASKAVRVIIAGTVPGADPDGGKFAHPGQRFQRALDLPEFESVELADAPDGIRFEVDSKSLIWDVPADQAVDRFVEILLLLTLPDGKQEYVTEKVEIRPSE